MIDAFKNITKTTYVFTVNERLVYDLQKGRVLQYKVTDKNYILQVEVRKRFLKLFLPIKLKACLFIVIYIL